MSPDPTLCRCGTLLGLALLQEPSRPLFAGWLFGFRSSEVFIWFGAIGTVSL